MLVGCTAIYVYGSFADVILITTNCEARGSWLLPLWNYIYVYIFSPVRGARCRTCVTGVFMYIYIYTMPSILPYRYSWSFFFSVFLLHLLLCFSLPFFFMCCGKSTYMDKSFFHFGVNVIVKGIAHSTCVLFFFFFACLSARGPRRYISLLYPLTVPHRARIKIKVHSLNFWYFCPPCFFSFLLYHNCYCCCFLFFRI